MLENIILSAVESIVREARAKVIKNNKTLNSLFREWLKNYVKKKSSLADYSLLMKELSHVKPGKYFPREELNERYPLIEEAKSPQR